MGGKRRLVLLLTMLCMAAARESGAASLSLSTSTPGPNPGDLVLVDVQVSGLGNAVAPSLTAFDLDVSFLPSVLSFVGVSFGPLIGFPGTSALVVSGASGGVVDLKETSLLPPTHPVLLFQPDSFLLATITFQALAGGPSALAFTQTLLSDENGAPIAVSGTSGVGILVTPEPGAATLIAGGLVLLAGRSRGRRAA